MRWFKQVITGMTTCGLSLYFLTQKGSEWHPVALIGCLVLFIIGYEQLRDAWLDTFKQIADKEWNEMKLSPEEQKEFEDFEMDDEEDILI